MASRPILAQQPHSIRTRHSFTSIRLETKTEIIAWQWDVKNDVYREKVLCCRSRSHTVATPRGGVWRWNRLFDKISVPRSRVLCCFKDVLVSIELWKDRYYNNGTKHLRDIVPHKWATIVQKVMYFLFFFIFFLCKEYLLENLIKDVAEKTKNSQPRSV